MPAILGGGCLRRPPGLADGDLLAGCHHIKHNGHSRRLTYEKIRKDDPRRQNRLRASYRDKMRLSAETVLRHRIVQLLHHTAAVGGKAKAISADRAGGETKAAVQKAYGEIIKGETA